MVYAKIEQDEESTEHLIDNLVKSSGLSDRQYLAAIVEKFNECEGIATGTSTHLSTAYALLQPSFSKAINATNDRGLIEFFYFTAEAHFDIGVLQLCSLYDEGKNNHSGIRDLDKFQNKIGTDSSLLITEKTESLYRSLKAYRDKGIAHPDRNAKEILQWQEPLELMYLTDRYITRFYNTHLFTDFESGDYSIPEGMRSTILNFNYLDKIDIDIAQWLQDAEEYYLKIDEAHK